MLARESRQSALFSFVNEHTYLRTKNRFHGRLLSQGRLEVFPLPTPLQTSRAGRYLKVDGKKYTIEANEGLRARANKETPLRRVKRRAGIKKHSLTGLRARQRRISALARKTPRKTRGGGTRE